MLLFSERVFVDGFQHAIWAAISGFFIGMAVNYPRRRVELIVFAVTVPAVLHGLNDWLAPHVWLWIGLQTISLLLFVGYTMSARSIEHQVRRTPLFRGDSIALDMSEPVSKSEPWGAVLADDVKAIKFRRANKD